MNNKQRNKLDTCARVEDFNTKNATTLATITDYATEQKTFDDAYTLAKQDAQTPANTGSVNSNTVDIAKHTMADTILTYAQRASVKAKQIGNTDLEDALDIAINYIYKADKIVAVQRAKDIRALLNNNLAILTNIDKTNIDEIDKSNFYWHATHRS